MTAGDAAATAEEAAVAPHDGVGQDLAGLDAVPAADDAYRQHFRARIARREMPWVLGLWTVAFAAVSVFHVASVGVLDVEAVVIAVGVLAILILVAAVVRMARFPDRWVPWAFALALAVVAMQFQWDYARHGQAAELALTVLVIACIGPLTASWTPFVAAMALVFAAQWLLLDSQALGPIIAAIIMTALLMDVRIRSLNRQADTTLLANRLATTDVVTGLLNGHGLERTLPRLEATARRLVQPVLVMCLDVSPAEPGSMSTTDHHAGLRTIASVIKSTVRADDLVARTSDHGFLVIGLGTRGDGSSMAHRVVSALDAASSERDHWAGRVRYAIVSDLLNLTDLPALIASAQSEMHGRPAEPR